MRKLSLRFNPGVPNTFKNRFYSKVSLPNELGCVLWKGARITDGYGVIGYGLRNISAIRASYLIHYGELVESCEILKMCSTPECLSPAHWVTRSYIQELFDKELI